ncbi:MAG: NADP-dependent methylenetetrahydromethanopterin/methylenetetrahydrofolate dehydrogenase [Mariniblastus sp.]|nr:NADP-dependent methylenetetrahydromethanopterin/methylenetetrahydrofolate dehydrogenase [Mariniblastus sp.]
MSKPKILIQLDPDSHVSTFDSVVAIDSGVDQLLTHSNVSVEQVEGIVHGAMFTRGPGDLRSTALFFGGSDVKKTEAIVEAAKNCFFGPMRVSVLSDPNGCNTTASAAVICAQKHIDLSDKTVTILAGTGPVGQRVAQIIGGPAVDQSSPPTVRICSRRMEKAVTVCEYLTQKIGGNFVPTQGGSAAESLAAIEGADAVFACGAAGVELLPADWAERSALPAVVVDLNAVPPVGVAGVGVMDNGVTKENGTVCFGAIGVGGLKMKIHKRALQMLFESNDQVLEVEEVYEIGRSL